MPRRGDFPKKKRSLGQVFLREKWPVQRVVDKLGDWKAERVLEIGPGGGALTRGLLDAGHKVTAVERDDRFVEKLEDYYQRNHQEHKGTLKVVGEDILKFDLEGWLQESGETTAVVGNIPYNISSPILLWCFPHIQKICGAMFLVQLEFAQRAAGQPGTKSYGSLSVFSQLRSHVEMECKVDRHCFQPVPKVDSALVTFRARKQQETAALLKNVETITRASFSQRRKKLRNAIANFLPEDRMRECPIDLNRRPETLRPDEFIELAKYVFTD